MRVGRRAVGLALAMMAAIAPVMGGVGASAAGAVSRGGPRTLSSLRAPSLRGAEGLCQIAYQVNRLTVTRSKPLNPETFAFPATVEVSKASQVQAAARALCALPAMPKGVFSCPMDLGVVYTLRFAVSDRSGVKYVEPVTIDASGCETVRGLGATRWAATAPSFWRLLGDSLGLRSASRLTFAGSLTSK
jgi:hypothetical protein